MKTYLFILGMLLFGREMRAQTGTQTLISSGDTWKYFATGVTPGSAAWRGNGSFDDAAWQQGPSQLGYGNDGERTVINYGPNPQDKFITTYFRKTLTLADASGTCTLTYKRDDGIIIYVNGTELKREYLPTGTITNTTLATVVPEAEEPLWKTIDLTASLLRVGTNVIAAEVHQASPTSSDMRFDLELKKITPSTTLPSPPTLTLQRGPYLQRYSDNPDLVIPTDKRSMTIRWSTDIAASSKVLYKKKTDPASPTTIYEQAEQAPPKAYSWTTGTNTLYDVSVTLNNLDPDTPYSYTIQSGGVSLQGDAKNYFRTAPLTGSSKKTRMWVLGDFGKQIQPNIDQNKVRDAFNTYVKDKVYYTQNEKDAGTDKYIDLWLWLGDNAYGWGVTEQYQNSVFKVYDGRGDANQSLMRQTPIFAVPGNHDYRGDDTTSRKNHSVNHYFDVINHMTAGDAVGMHSKKEEYYSFDHGNIHFVSLDSYGYQKTAAGVQETTVFPAGGAQLTWLESDLARAQSSPLTKWIIVFVHHPPYTITEGSHNSDTDQDLKDIRERLVKNVLEKYKVDLVLTGHSHNYQRSWPIQGHYGLEQEFIDNKDNYRVPVAATMSASGRYDCVAFPPSSSTLVSNASLIYNKRSAEPNRTIYVVNGSGGGTEGNAGSKWPHDAMQGFAWEAGSMYLEVEGNRLDGKFINAEGVVRDQFKIIKDADTFTIPVTDGTTHKPDCECNDAAAYTHYVERTPAGNANLLLSIKKNGNAIGTVGDGTFDLQLKGQPGGTTVLYNYPNNYVRAFYHDKDEGDWTVMNRHWTLKPTVELPNQSQFAIRHYYKDADLYAARPFWLSHTNMKFLKYNDSGSFEAQTADPTEPGGQAYAKVAKNYKSSGVWVYDNGPAPSPSGWAYKSLGNGNHYGEFVTGRLMNGGGIGAFSTGGNPTGMAPLVMAGSVWKYYVSHNAPASANWKGGGSFDDSAWPQGQAPIGYSPNGEDGEVTRIPICPDPNCTQSTWTTYFRKNVFFNSRAYASSLPLADQRSLVINYKRDDGIVIYLNGTEIWRENMPSGVITHTTQASMAVGNEAAWQTVIVPLTNLREGENVLAAEVHQISQSIYSDLRFDLEVVVSPYGSSPYMPSPLSRVAAEETVQPQETGVVVYPNPTIDGKVIFSPALLYQSYMLTDSQGKVVREVSKAGRLEQLDLSNLQPGVYVLVSQNTKGTHRFKLIWN